MSYSWASPTVFIFFSVYVNVFVEEDDHLYLDRLFYSLSKPFKKINENKLRQLIVGLFE